MSVYWRKQGDGAKRWHYRKRVKITEAIARELESRGVTISRTLGGVSVRIAGTPAINTQRAAEQAERAHIEEILNPAPPAPPPIVLVPTVAEYAERWIAGRVGRLVSAGDDDARIRLHALPVIGHLRMDEVRPRHLRDLILALRAAGELAPRTILKISGVLHAMFKSAEIEDLIMSNPVKYEPGVLPKKADKDPHWRHEAIYTRGEIERLLSDERIPPDRRMLYGLKTLAALRHTEAATLAWRQLDVGDPLGRINLGETKSGVPRAVPVHPTLAKMLATWRLVGWFNTYGRRPRPEDLVVPTLTMRSRAAKESQEALVADLGVLELRTEAGAIGRRRRGHDMRRTFISLAIADGARRDVIEWGTHGPRGDIMNMYTTLPWSTLCEEWSKLKIELLEGALISLQHDEPSEATTRARLRWAPGGHDDDRDDVDEPQGLALVRESLATPTGFERTPEAEPKPAIHIVKRR